MDRAKPSVLEKALDVLELLLARPDGCPARELGDSTGYPAGTLHRLLGVLVRRGFARQDPLTKRYLVGAQLAGASSGLGAVPGLAGLGLPDLKRLDQADHAGFGKAIEIWESIGWPVLDRYRVVLSPVDGPGVRPARPARRCAWI